MRTNLCWFPPSSRLSLSFDFRNGLAAAALAGCSGDHGATNEPSVVLRKR